MAELGKGSIPVSFKLMQSIDGKDICACKGLKLGKVGASLLGQLDILQVACTVPSAALVGFASVAVGAETGHCTREQ